MQLAISGQALGDDRPLEKILALLNELDVRWIDLWPQNLEGGDRTRPGWTNRYEGRDAGRAEEQLNAYGIGVSCITMPGAYVQAMADDADDYLAALEAAVDLAVRLRVKFVNSYVYHFSLGPNAGFEPIVEVLRTAADYAAHRGVTLLLENEAHDTTATADGMLRILDAVGSPALRTTFDAANYYQASEEPFPDAYLRLRDHIGYLHLKGAAVYDPSRHPEYGRGGTITGRLGDEHVFYAPLPETAFNAEQILARAAADRVSEFCMIEPHVPPDHVEEYYRIEVPYLRGHGVH
jgi:sugar phosphate isomerase/epimerase